MSKRKVEIGRASDDEALRLTIAYYCIMEPEKRAEVQTLAETFAAQSRRVDGVTHYLEIKSNGRKKN